MDPALWLGTASKSIEGPYQQRAELDVDPRDVVRQSATRLVQPNTTRVYCFITGRVFAVAALESGLDVFWRHWDFLGEDAVRVSCWKEFLQLEFDVRVEPLP